jgi:RNA polymerase sigma-70 factor (family 1)
VNKYGNYSDHQVTNLLNSGDQFALTEIHRRYYGILYNHAYRRLANREEVRDILQTMFQYLWENHKTIRFTTSLSGYLYTSVRNRIINHYRNEKVKDDFMTSLQVFVDQERPVIEEELAEKELIILIEQEVEALPKQMKLVFEMSRKENMSHNEVALLLNLSPHTVRNHIHSALKILRKKLGTNRLLFLI